MRRWGKAVGAGVVGLAVFVGVPLLGWGIGDLVGYAGNRLRLAYLGVSVAVTLVSCLFVPLPERVKGEGRAAGWQGAVVPLLQALGLALMLVGPFSDRRGVAVMGDHPLLRSLGLILFTSGMGLAGWAQVALGPWFSIQVTIREGHRLVTSGPFRWIRHPRYLGILLFSLGYSLVFRSWWALLIALAHVPPLLFRIRAEEDLLSRTFGKEWQDYAGRSWRLFPFLF